MVAWDMKLIQATLSQYAIASLATVNLFAYFGYDTYVRTHD